MTPRRMATAGAMVNTALDMAMRLSAAASIPSVRARFQARTRNTADCSSTNAMTIAATQ